MLSVSAFHFGRDLYHFSIITKPSFVTSKREESKMVVWRQRPKIHIWLKTDQKTLRRANASLVTAVCALSKGAEKSGLLRSTGWNYLWRAGLFFSPSYLYEWSFSVQITWPLSLRCVVVDLKWVLGAEGLPKFRNKHCCCWEKRYGQLREYLVTHRQDVALSSWITICLICKGEEFEECGTYLSALTSPDLWLEYPELHLEECRELFLHFWS